MKKFLNKLDLKKLLSARNSSFIIIGLFIIVRFALINFNAAEWGDSYRILRAAEAIKHGYYPEDEKRPPLFSLLLATRPLQVDPIMYGRIVMFFITVASAAVFYRLTQLAFVSKIRQNLALIIFLLNPIYLYWSLRIYADTFYTLFVLIMAYVYVAHYQKNKTYIWSLAMAALGVISVVTRFEGYLLLLAGGVGILFPLGLKDLVEQFRKNLSRALAYGISAIIMLFPFYAWRNPFASSYFSETATRSFGMNELLIFIASFLFATGSIILSALIFERLHKLKEFAQNNTFLVSYVFLITVLTLLWTAAVPRLLTSAIPFLSIIAAYCLTDVMSKAVEKKIAIISMALSLFYILIQFKYKLQFLMPDREVFAVLLTLNVLAVVLVYVQKIRVAAAVLFISLCIWTFSVINLHQGIFGVLALGAKQANQLEGTVAYNDISALTPWYLESDPARNSQVVGRYIKYTQKSDLSLDKLQSYGADYLLLTNEHNLGLEINETNLPYLEKIGDFSKTVNGGEFITKLYKVKYN